jgi:long-chain acyl-CoA synthetase
MTEPFRDLIDLFERSCVHFADRPLFGEKRNGAFVWTSYREVHELVAHARAGLARLGVGSGDRVAMIANNCVEWAVSAYATFGLGATFVPMYEAQQPSEWAFILEDSGAKVAIVATKAIAAQLPSLPNVIALDDMSGWPALLRNDAEVPLHPLDPDSIAAFVYTSGTTGKPKGVMQSHRNIVANVNALHEIFPLDPEDRALSFLPWAHSYGQTVEVHGLISMGCSAAINDKLENLIPHLAEVQPTIILAVPRIFNRIYQSVNEQIAAKPGVVQALVRAGIRAAIKKEHGVPLSLLERGEIAFDEKAIFHKIRERFGGRLKYAISGSATLGRDVAEFIDALGITVYEGYGLTEASCIVSANAPGARRMGSVGKVLPGERVVIDTSVGNAPNVGEIVVYGPNVMVGYHQRPEENDKALTSDHGLRTGDLGYLDEDGYLFIAGRIKEQYKLTNGKYVVPSPLEEELKLSPYIANVMIHGDAQPYNVAIVSLDLNAVRRWAEHEKVLLDPDIAHDPRVRDLLAHELEHHASGFKMFEKPRQFALVADEWTQATGMLTPTLKLKRAAVLGRYRGLLKDLYGQ